MSKGIDTQTHGIHGYRPIRSLRVNSIHFLLICFFVLSFYFYSMLTTPVNDTKRHTGHHRNKSNRQKTPDPSTDLDPIRRRFVATMMLAGVGDTLGLWLYSCPGSTFNILYCPLGFKNGEWEFNLSGPAIHEELESLGGLKHINLRDWGVSDDQVLHLATAEALIDTWSTKEELFETVARHFLKASKDMDGRAPGSMTLRAIQNLKHKHRWNTMPYFDNAGGNGASVRAMCIGLLYSHEKDIDELVSISVECGRISHNHPTGFLGSVASAFFTSFAVRDIPPVAWGRKFVKEILPIVYAYLEKSGRDWDKYQPMLKYFEKKLNQYIRIRHIKEEGKDHPVFPQGYDAKMRDEFYSSISWNGWGGASGDDAIIIAYDSLLGSKGNWEELLYRGVFHGGDSDTTGVLCCAWFGAVYGFDGMSFPFIPK